MSNAVTPGDAALNARMLFHIGGAGNADRVDVSDLFAQRLAAMGMDIDYVLFDRNPGPYWQQDTWHDAKAFTIGKSAKPGVVGSIDNKCRQLFADIRTVWLTATGNYELVQIRDRFFVAPLALLVARLRGIKFCYWLSYPYPESRMIEAREGRARFAWLGWLYGRTEALILYRLVLPFADLAFVQSEQMRSDIAAAGVDPSGLIPVPMGVNERWLEQPPAEVVPNTIVYLGTLVRIRRLSVLVEALAKVRESVPDARLILIGDGEDPEDRALIEAKADELNLTQAVELTGMLPMEQALQRTATGAVCVSPFYPTPTLLSTSPTKISEYFALARPVVANEHPEQSAILAASDGGICVAWSATEFAAAIVELLNDPGRADTMGINGRNWVAQNRTYAKIASQVAPHYQNLLSTAVDAQS